MHKVKEAVRRNPNSHQCWKIECADDRDYRKRNGGHQFLDQGVT